MFRITASVSVADPHKLDADPNRVFTLMRIRILPFTFSQIGPSKLTLLRLAPFHFDPDPVFHFDPDLDPASQK
jgi:hypothetical protein